ncbi:unnamed protein product [Lupinus luteus]|uniref:Cytochrome P450 n=1 Tax=Lupinus luteus TaxID=3873 RepID=A0AAV1W1D7_LUPLU
MANLVKYPHMQQRIVEEIRKVMAVSDREEKEEVHEEDLEKLPYLKAVLLESLRRHPPTHFLLPHAVTEDVALNGYLVPKKGNQNLDNNVVSSETTEVVKKLKPVNGSLNGDQNLNDVFNQHDACFESETTAAALQWIMANLVKYPHMQQRVVDEIRKVMEVSDREEKEEVQEEDLEKLPYLKAVVL